MFTCLPSPFFFSLSLSLNQTAHSVWMGFTPVTLAALIRAVNKEVSNVLLLLMMMMQNLGE